MADTNQQVCEEPHGQQQHGGPFAFAVAVYTIINRSVAAVFHAVNRDGTLAAAFRQGAGEIGQALKAFPDSIQVHEPGTILSPTASDIVDARDAHAASPSPIAQGNAGTVYGPEQTTSQVAPSPGDKGQATVHGPQQSATPAVPSPSDIARGNTGTVHGQQQDDSRAEPSPSDIARGNGQVLEQEKTWQEKEIEREKARQDGNAGNDQNERAKGRSLPDEQKEQEKERGRGR